MIGYVLFTLTECERGGNISSKGDNEMKKLFVILLAMICMCCFVACGIYGGYNGIMYECLNLEDGIKNIIRMMDGERTIL